MSKNLDEQILEQSILIKTLEATYPKEYKSTAWHIHHTRVRDVYWKRRMLTARRDGDNDAYEAAAEIY